MYLKDTNSNKTVDEKHEPIQYEVNAQGHARRHSNTIVQRSFNPMELRLWIRLWGAEWDGRMLL
jgi:hypothetical protein